MHKYKVYKAYRTVRSGKKPAGDNQSSWGDGHVDRQASRSCKVLTNRRGVSTNPNLLQSQNCAYYWQTRLRYDSISYLSSMVQEANLTGSKIINVINVKHKNGSLLLWSNYLAVISEQGTSVAHRFSMHCGSSAGCMFYPGSIMSMSKADVKPVLYSWMKPKLLPLHNRNTPWKTPNGADTYKSILIARFSGPMSVFWYTESCTEYMDYFVPYWVTMCWHGLETYTAIVNAP